MFGRNLDWLLKQVEVEEYLGTEERKELELLPLAQALAAMHRPTSTDQVEGGRRRLAFDELFFLQLVQAQVRFRQTEAEPGIAFGRTNDLIKPLHDSLPFELTGAQARVLREILGDMASPRRMSRLLQGDVGSGKTVVALFAMLMALEGGYQAALMAPTEILAEQHARKLGTMLGPIGVDVFLLTGSLGAQDRRRVLNGWREAKPVSWWVPTPSFRKEWTSIVWDWWWWMSNTGSVFGSGWSWESRNPGPTS